MPDVAAPASIGLQTWQATAAYAPGDIVEYNGALYQASSANIDQPPTPSVNSPFWQPFDPSVGAPGGSGDPSLLTPTVDCVVPGPGTTFTAVFGYVNSGANPAVVPVSPVAPMNRVAGGGWFGFLNSSGRGQPIVFQPGAHDAVFAVNSSTGTAVTWNLGGRIVGATSASPVCATTMGPDGPIATVNGSSIFAGPDPASILSTAMAGEGRGQTIVGTTSGAFQVGSDGAGTYGIPLWTPPALMGIGPSLSLSYSSRAGRGLLGTGWSLTGVGISRITRCQTTLAQDGDATPVDFSGTNDTFCRDGQRLLPTNDPAVNGKVVYQTERDPFTRVLFDPTAQSFEVDQPDGRVLTYGTTTASRQMDSLVVWTPGQRLQGPNPDVLATYAWALDSVRDPFGNEMDVSYTVFVDDHEALTPSNSCNELLPQTISYTKGPSQAPLRSVTFTYEKPALPEASCRYVNGFPLGGQARLHQLSMSGPGATAAPEVLRTYTMAYHQSAATDHSLLDSVQECDRFFNCKPPTTFTYAPGQSGEYVALPLALASLSSTPDLFAAPIVATRFVDLNQDGKDDVVFLGTSYYTGPQTPGVYNEPLTVEGYALSDGSKVGPPHVLTNEGPPSAPYGPTAGWWYPLGSQFSSGPVPTGNTFLNTVAGGACSSRGAGGSPSHGNARTCPLGNSLALSTLNTTNDTWNAPNLVPTPGAITGWGIYTPYVIADLDGNGTADILGTTSAGTAWRYWLNNTAWPEQTVTDPALGIADPKGLTYQYAARLDGTGKSALLFRPGDPNAISNLVSVVVHGAGSVSASETTLTMAPDGLTMPCNPPDPSSQFCQPVHTYAPSASHYMFMDVNGDGNDDALVVPNSGGPPQVMFNTGAGFGPVQNIPGVDYTAHLGVAPYDLPAYETMSQLTSESSSNPDYGQAGITRIADLNEDGLPDLLIANNDEASDPTTGAPTGGNVVAYLSNGARGFQAVTLMDSNGGAIQQGGTPPPSAVPPPYHAGGDVFMLPYGVEVLDFDGDGQTDIYANGLIHVRQSTGNKADELVTVQDGLGKVTSVTYAAIGRDPGVVDPATNVTTYTPATDCQYPIQCLVKGMWVVSSFQESGDLALPSLAPVSPHVPVRIYSYAGGRSDLRGRGWLGFDRVESFDLGDGGNPTAWGTHTTTTYSPPGTDIGFGYPLAGAPKTVTVSAITATPASSGGSPTEKVHTSTTLYNVILTLGGRGAVIRPTEVDVVDSETTPSASYVANLSSTTTLYGYDSPTAPFNINAVNTTWNLSGETRSSTATYTSNTSNGKWFLSMLTSSSETSTVPGGGSVTRARKYLRNANTGAVDVEVVEPNHSSDVYSETKYLRLPNGQVYDVNSRWTDPLRVKSLVRDTWLAYSDFDGVFPSLVTNSLGQATRTVYHPGLGVLAFSEDPNGVKVHATYDFFGRQRTVSPDGRGATTTTYRSGQPYKEANPVPGLFTVESETAGGGDTWVTYNALGHEVVRGTRNHDGTLSYTETQYTGAIPGQVGLISQVHPYGVAGPGFATTFGYDQLGRLTNTSLPGGGAVFTSYVGPATTVTDPRGYARTRVVDDVGRLVRVDEDSVQWPSYPKTSAYQRPGTAVSTNYAYAPFGQVATVSVTARDANGGGTTPLKSVTYDVLGRRTKLVDADNGETVTTYDGLGEVTSEGDANGDLHIPARDVLGRVIADYSTRDGATYYQWDTAPYGAGRLASATSPDNVTTSYAYFSNGLPASTTWSIPAYGTYTVNTPPDSYGRVAQLQYPNGAAQVTMGYDEVGALSRVSMDGQPSVLSWQAAAWQPDGKVTVEQYGITGGGDSGSTTRTYDPNRGWLTGISTSGNGTPVQQISYPSHDLNGNVTERDDALAATTETFHNDFLNRLDTWSFASPGQTTTTSFTYDDLGNLQTRSAGTAPSTGVTAQTTYVSGTRDAGTTPGVAGVHALASVGADSYAYDGKGNQVSAPGRTVGYSSFNLPKSVTTAAGTTTYLYDANHTRVVKQGPTGTTVYIGGIYERRTDPQNNVTDVCYIPGGGRIVAQTVQPMSPTLGPPVVHYLHDDHLGSIESITGTDETASGGVSAVLPTQHFKYDPFGKRIDPGTGAPTTARASDLTSGFTDQEHEDELGLINMQGRIYDPGVGRFLSTDPLTDGSSQGLNAYSYVGNNPLNFTDPSGFDKINNDPCVNESNTGAQNKTGLICGATATGTGSGTLPADTYNAPGAGGAEGAPPVPPGAGGAEGAPPVQSPPAEDTNGTGPIGTPPPPPPTPASSVPSMAQQFGQQQLIAGVTNTGGGPQPSAHPANNSSTRIHSQAEVQQQLHAYVADLYTSSVPMYVMYERHKAFGAYDFLMTAKDSDRFDVPKVGVLTPKQYGNFIAGYAAGYMRSAVAYWSVRVAGALYGVLDRGGGPTETPQWKYLGDDYDSVLYIDIGVWRGMSEWQQGGVQSDPPGAIGIMAERSLR